MEKIELQAMQQQKEKVKAIVNKDIISQEDSIKARLAARTRKKLSRSMQRIDIKGVNVNKVKDNEPKTAGLSKYMKKPKESKEQPFPSITLTDHSISLKNLSAVKPSSLMPQLVNENHNRRFDIGKLQHIAASKKDLKVSPRGGGGQSNMISLTNFNM